MTRIQAVAAVRSFNRFYTNVLGVLERHFLESPYSLTEVRILYEIAHAPGTTARAIRNFLLVDEGYLSRTIDAMTARGLITRTRSDRDGRSYLLTLSPNGKKLFRTLDRRQSRDIAALLAPLTAGEIRETVLAMRRVRELLARKGGSRGEPA